MRISVLVPSRERSAALVKSLRSLGDRDLELLIRIDEDDPERERYARIPRVLDGGAQRAGLRTRVIVGKRHGYRRLHLYYNELAAAATGDWIMIWNDDCLMETEGWIDVVHRYRSEMVVLNPNTNHENWKIDMNVFPIVPRAMVQLMGHVSLSPHNDSWLEFVGREAGIMVRVPIMILHDRADLTGSNDDGVFAARHYERDAFHSRAMKRARERDIRLIRAHLRAQEKGAAAR
jgi:hypothetical protein